MKSYLLRLSGREAGPFSEEQVAQMFADGRVDRSAPCKPATGGEWRTIDEYLPTLKYGTQLPAPTRSPVVPSVGSRQPTPFVVDQRVALVDIDLPFMSILRMMFKFAGAWLIVALCLLPVMALIWFVIMLVFAGLIGGAMSGLGRP